MHKGLDRKSERNLLCTAFTISGLLASTPPSSLLPRKLSACRPALVPEQSSPAEEDGDHCPPDDKRQDQERPQREEVEVAEILIIGHEPVRDGGNPFRFGSSSHRLFIAVTGRAFESLRAHQRKARGLAEMSGPLCFSEPEPNLMELWHRPQAASLCTPCLSTVLTSILVACDEE